MRGYALVALSAVVYALSVLMVRLAQDAGAPTELILLSRFAFQTVLFSCQMAVKGVPLFPSTRFGKRILLVSSTLVTAACFGYVAASAWAPLGDANAIGGTFPIGTLVVARLWLKEPFGYAGLPSLLMSATGIALISLGHSSAGGPEAAPPSVASSSGGSLEALGYAAATFSALANSFAYTTIRRAGDAFEPLQNMFLYSALGLLLVLPLALHSELSSVASGTWLSLVPPLAAVSTLGALAQMLLSYGSMAPDVTAGATSLISSSEMIWAYLLQVTVLHQPASRAAVGGVALILLAIITPLVEHEATRRSSHLGGHAEKAGAHAHAPSMGRYLLLMPESPAEVLSDLERDLEKQRLLAAPDS